MIKYYLSLIIFLFTFSISAYSQTAEAYLKKGDDLYRQGNYDKAIEQYDIVIKLEPNLVTAYINKGQALEFLRRFPDAISTYDLLLKRMPQQTKALTRKGIALIKI